MVLHSVWVFVSMGAEGSLGEAPRLLSARCISPHSCAAQAGQPWIKNHSRLAAGFGVFLSAL